MIEVHKEESIIQKKYQEIKELLLKYGAKASFEYKDPNTLELGFDPRYW